MEEEIDTARDMEFKDIEMAEMNSEQTWDEAAYYDAEGYLIEVPMEE